MWECAAEPVLQSLGQSITHVTGHWLAPVVLMVLASQLPALGPSNNLMLSTDRDKIGSFMISAWLTTASVVVPRSCVCGWALSDSLEMLVHTSPIWIFPVKLSPSLAQAMGAPSVDSHPVPNSVLL